MYILTCSDGSFYVGSAKDLDQRMEQHTLGVADSYTANRRPVELAYAAEFDRVDEAWAMERRVKGWRREKRIALIEGRLADLPALARTARPKSAGAS